MRETDIGKERERQRQTEGERPTETDRETKRERERAVKVYTLFNFFLNSYSVLYLFAVSSGCQSLHRESEEAARESEC